MTIKAMFSYNNASEGAKELSEILGIPRVKHNGSKFKGSKDKILLNWGATTERFTNPELAKCTVINKPENVDIAVNKTLTFQKFREAGVPSPEFTTNRTEALAWLEAGTMVFARTQLRAHSGRGIVIMDPEHPDTWEQTAPLYVKYISKKHEYRIHVCRGAVIDTQRKGLRPEHQGTEGVNWKIRNLANGFIYTRNDGHVVPPCVLDAGIRSVQALGLDFGASDVIFNQASNRAYALEVNTAPGLTGATVTNYRTAMAGF
jgi:glutathione synthase/RimK-type ligase-like ATP-grasp enzyme